MDSILVTGGAGFIGSHMCKSLALAGYNVIVLDILSTGAAENAKYGKLVFGSCGDKSVLEKIFTEQKVSCVIHFAGSSLVNESTSNPDIYYQNNVVNLVSLLGQMVRFKIDKFIFSSSAAVYGSPVYLPIDEKHPTEPVNVYGRTKLFCEHIVSDFCNAFQLNALSLRYFNAVGCDPSGELGECHDPETHLVPSVLKSALDGTIMTVHGADYDTNDGTCVRDFVHVVDLCSAHNLGMRALFDNKIRGFNTFNLGIGKGYSVREIIEICKSVTVKDSFMINEKTLHRRNGDPACLVADPTSANERLNWYPEYSIEDSIEHTWSWLKSIR